MLVCKSNNSAKLATQGVFAFSVSYKSCWSCCDQVDNEKSEKLKDKLQEYLQYSPPLENGQVTALSFTRELNVKGVTELFEVYLIVILKF